MLFKYYSYHISIIHYCIYLRQDTELLKVVSKYLSKMPWNDPEISKLFIKIGGPSSIIECLNTFTDKSTLEGIFTLLGSISNCSSECGELLDILVKQGLISSMFRCIPFGAHRGIMLLVLNRLVDSSRIPSYDCEPLMVNILTDPNASSSELSGSLFLVDFIPNPSLSYTPELISAVITHLDNSRATVDSRASAISALLKGGKEGKIPDNTFNDLAKKAIAAIESGGACLAHSIVTLRYPDKLVELGLVELVTQFLDKPDSSDVDKYKFYAVSSLLELVKNKPQNQLLALSAGAMGYAMKLLSTQLKNSEPDIFAFSLVIKLLENTMSHYNFIDLGGVKLFSEVIAKHKKLGALQTLYAIGRASEPLLQVIASDLALSAQLAIAVKSTPPKVKTVILEMMALFTKYNIPIHPALASSSIPTLIGALYFEEKNFISASLSILTPLVESDDGLRALAASHGAASAVTKLLETVEGEDRVNAQRLKVKLPDAPKFTSAPLPQNKAMAIHHLKMTPIQGTFDIACAQIANGILSAKTLYVLLIQSLEDSTKVPFEDITKIVLCKEKMSDLEVELFLVLAMVMASDLENYRDVIACCRVFEEGLPSRSTDTLILLSITDFIGTII